MMLKDKRKEELIKFISPLGLNIENLDLLNLALTHSSYVKENYKKSSNDNERLEFFGDAILKLFVSEYLMKKYPNYTEGELSSLRAVIVSEKILASIAKKLNFDKHMLIGRNEKKSLPSSIVADSLEALLAVIYYDCGPHLARDFIFKYWAHYIETADKNKEKDNFKAVLQELLQGNKSGLPIYKTIFESGPDHNKEFEVAVLLNENELARGIGKTKKEASQHAAKNALNYFKKQRAIK